MPSAAIVAIANTIVMGTALTDAAAFLVASVIVKGATAIGISAIAGKIFGPKLPDFANDAQGRTQMVRSPIGARRIIYGQAKVGGPLMFATTTGGRNGMLHLVEALAAHDCEEIGAVYFNDKLESEYDQTDPNQVRISKHLGATDQAADSDLVSEVTEWTTAHRLRGVCYLYVRLWWSAKIFPTGIPSVSAIVKGKKIYDPRTGATAWSDNPALCIRDYLLSDLGLGAGSDEIDEGSFMAAASICDELVTVPDGSGGTVTEARYTCNGTVNADTAPLDAIGSLLTSCAGTLTYVEGKYRLTAGSYTLPTWEMDEDDLRADIQVQGATPRKELYNAVRGIYVNPDDNWAPTDMPPVNNTAYSAADGATIYREIELPYTTSVYTAQRIGKVHLEQSRQRLTITFPAKIGAFRLNAWDVVNLSIERFGWVSKPFRVLEWQFSQDGGVDLLLREDNPAIWDWVYTEATTPAAATAITNATEAEPGPPTGLSVTDTAVLSTVGVDFSWTRPADDPNVIVYEVQYKINADSTYLEAGTTRNTTLRITGLEPDTLYDFRVRSVYNNGADSDWASTTHTTDEWAANFIGEVRIWTGAIGNIPTGWSLCDGSTVNGFVTPDLRDRFLVGAGSTFSVGDTGGTADPTTLTTETTSLTISEGTTSVDNNLDASTTTVVNSVPDPTPNPHDHDLDIALSDKWDLIPHRAVYYICYTG